MPGYETRLEWVAIRGAERLLIRSLRDRDQFADPQGVAAALGISSAAWPMFGVLWPSGVQLAARLALRPVHASERILEIGCGLGLASLVAHRRGADVTASDRHPLAGAFLAENLLLNRLGPMKFRRQDWEDAPEDASEDPRQPTAAVRGAAAAPPDGDGRFELIVGSDLLYERDARGLLAGFIARHAAPGGEVLIVDPDRANRSAFNRRMAAEGFGLREERVDRAAGDGLAAYKGRLLRYRRGGPGA